jgi:fatty acid desaturase
MWVTISFILVSLDCEWLLLVLFGLLVVAALNVLAGAGVLLCVHATHNRVPHITKITGDNYNGRKENRITANNRILTITACTPEDGQLGRNI